MLGRKIFFSLRSKEILLSLSFPRLISWFLRANFYFHNYNQLSNFSPGKMFSTGWKRAATTGLGKQKPFFLVKKRFKFYPCPASTKSFPLEPAISYENKWFGRNCWHVPLYLLVRHYSRVVGIVFPFLIIPYCSSGEIEDQVYWERRKKFGKAFITIKKSLPDARFIKLIQSCISSNFSSLRP